MRHEASSVRALLAKQESISKSTHAMLDWVTISAVTGRLLWGAQGTAFAACFAGV